MADDTLILAFDTATPQCSCAVTSGGIHGGTVIGSIALESGITHSRRLLGSIEKLLRDTEVALKNISAVAVGLGPGSFTGLRIGMATAKGLAHGAKKQLIGISSLDAIASEITADGLICILLDARKKEVYGRFYRGVDGIIEPCSAPFVTPPDKLLNMIDEPVVMAGDGAVVYQDLLEDGLGSTVVISAEKFPSAEMIGFLAYHKYKQSEFLDLANAAPLYVRASDAELSLVKVGSRG